MNNDYDQIQNYLSDIVKDYMRLIISDFAILWNKYEESLFNKNYHSSKIEINVIDRLKNEENSMNSDFMIKIKALYSRTIKYFQYRHITVDYDNLRDHYSIRDNDISREKLEELIRSNNFMDKLYFLLFIAGRIRNNMFHGIKGINDLPNQKELFIICNETLALVLKATNNWPL